MEDKRKLLEESHDLNKLESAKAFLNTSDNQKNATDNTFMK